MMLVSKNFRGWVLVKLIKYCNEKFRDCKSLNWMQHLQEYRSIEKLGFHEELEINRM